VSVVSYWLLVTQRVKASTLVNRLGAVLYPLPIIGVGIFIWFTVNLISPI
jgi:hypothetical protein